MQGLESVTNRQTDRRGLNHKLAHTFITYHLSINVAWERKGVCNGPGGMPGSKPGEALVGQPQPLPQHGHLPPP